MRRLRRKRTPFLSTAKTAAGWQTSANPLENMVLHTDLWMTARDACGDVSFPRIGFDRHLRHAKQVRRAGVQET